MQDYTCYTKKNLMAELLRPKEKPFYIKKKLNNSNSRSISLYDELILRDRTNGFFYFIIICFYAIMHRTIVQNKIITIICSCLFFGWLIFIGLV